jgi:hypothetical protein
MAATMSVEGAEARAAVASLRASAASLRTALTTFHVHPDIPWYVAAS